MTKRLSAVTGEYTKDGQQKAEWTNVGVIITGKNGKDYALLDPSVNLAGVLIKQNVLAAKKGEQPSDMVMTSIFEEQQSQQQGGYQQQAPQHQQQPPQQQPGFQQNEQGYGGSQQQQGYQQQRYQK